MTNEIPALSTRVLVTDFDGTMTRRDFYQLAIARLLPPDSPDYWGEFLAGRLTHFAALQSMFAQIHADDATILAVAEEMELDPRLPPAVQKLQAAGWEIVVASAGCDWYIQRLLARRGVALTVHANPGELQADGTLCMTPPLASPFYDADTGISKEAVTRNALAQVAEVAFAGDGRPDLLAALLVAPEYRFARGWLAQHLSAEQIPYHGFEHWSDIAEMLL